MPNGYSNDLRDRVLQYYDAGHTQLQGEKSIAQICRERDITDSLCILKYTGQLSHLVYMIAGLDLSVIV